LAKFDLDVVFVVSLLTVDSKRTKRVCVKGVLFSSNLFPTEGVKDMTRQENN